MLSGYEMLARREYEATQQQPLQESKRYNQATDPAFFLDGMAFFDSRHGLAVADPIDGKFQILSTTDGGRSWAQLPTAGMPSVPPDEYGFADSGSMITTQGRDAWFGTGGSAAQILHSQDGGFTWDVASTPIRAEQALRRVRILKG